MPRPAILLSILAGLGSPGLAHAELGGSAANIRTEGAHMRARVATVAMRGYARHELTRPNGGAIHEFANAAGQVFAVTWSGPGKPDLRALLGRYFQTLQTSGNPGNRAGRALRRTAMVDRPDLQIQSAGHMGWFRGVAYIPSLAPAGFSPSDLPVAS